MVIPGCQRDTIEILITLPIKLRVWVEWKSSSAHTFVSPTSHRTIIIVTSGGRLLSFNWIERPSCCGQSFAHIGQEEDHAEEEETSLSICRLWRWRDRMETHVPLLFAIRLLSPPSSLQSAPFPATLSIIFGGSPDRDKRTRRIRRHLYVYPPRGSYRSSMNNKLIQRFSPSTSSYVSIKQVA